MRKNANAQCGNSLDGVVPVAENTLLRISQHPVSRKNWQSIISTMTGIRDVTVHPSTLFLYVWNVIRKNNTLRKNTGNTSTPYSKQGLSGGSGRGNSISCRSYTKNRSLTLLHNYLFFTYLCKVYFTNQS